MKTTRPRARAVTMAPRAVPTLEHLGNIRRQLNLVAVKMLKKHGLHPKQMIMLRFVSAHSEVTLTQLARGTATDMAAASRAIGPLVKNGWLRKTRNPDDGRCWKIRLTPRAERQMVYVHGVYADLARTMTAPLAKREVDQLHELLTKVTTALAQSLAQNTLF